MAKLKVLLVDDEPDFIELMGSRIDSWGVDLVTAADGAEALDKIGIEKPDIVILDYMMPGMDGLEVLKKIRAADKKIPVVILTAYPNVNAIKGTEKMGISAYIPKLSSYSDAQSALRAVMDEAVRRLKRDALK